MRRVLGRSGIEVSAMGMGCWAIGGPFSLAGVPIGWGQVDDAESKAAALKAFESGVTFFDTSDAYGAGHSEIILGEAFSSMRDQVVLATKFGNVIDEANRELIGHQADKTYIRQACEESLRRLRTDYIDLYQFHLGDYSVEEAPAVRETLESLVGEGKIRSYAWSTDHRASAAVFAEGENCTAVRHRLNVFEDAQDVIALCEAENLASINRSPLGMGLLTGKYAADAVFAPDDIRSNPDLDWVAYFEDGKPNASMLKRLDAMREILTSDGRTLAQGALAWLWARSEHTVPIPGIRTVAQAEENAGAMAFGPLTAAHMVEIGSLARA